MNPAESADRVQCLILYWQTLSPQSLPRLGEIYAEEAYFRDPFNEVRGLPAIERIFAEMFERLIEPRFTIIETVVQGEDATLIWDFDFCVKSWQPAVARRIHGLSHVRFGADGRVIHHRDYWDAAGELYEQLPVVGALMRWLKKRMA